MKSDENALFEIKSDEKALSDEELKSFVGDEGGLLSGTGLTLIIRSP